MLDNVIKSKEEKTKKIKELEAEIKKLQTDITEKGKKFIKAVAKVKKQANEKYQHTIMKQHNFLTNAVKFFQFDEKLTFDEQCDLLPSKIATQNEKQLKAIALLKEQFPKAKKEYQRNIKKMKTEIESALDGNSSFVYGEF